MACGYPKPPTYNNISSNYNHNIDFLYGGTAPHVFSLVSSRCFMWHLVSGKYTDLIKMTQDHPDFSAVNLHDLSRRLHRLEHDHQGLQKAVETLQLANESLEAKNQALEREVLQLRTVQNDRAIGTNNAFAEIERDMEDADETFRQICAALRVVDERIPLGLDVDWLKAGSDAAAAPAKVRNTREGILKSRSRKPSLQPGQQQPQQATIPAGNCRSVSISGERPIPSNLEERLRLAEDKLKRLCKVQEVSDRSLAEAQKTISDLHVNLRPAQVLAKKFVDANGWTEKELSHWRNVLSADGSYGSPLLLAAAPEGVGGGAIGAGTTGKKPGKTVTIQREAHSVPASRDPDLLVAPRSAAGNDAKLRRHMRRKSSSDLLFVPPPGDTRPMSLFYCTIM
ncbi:hypothetical protein BV898_00171 [Hypsibius exemplaris]|uniref:Uncharacterized protein n=1 Tax=Hypsibius exemplaris TaxID=2072580 RepID=A0A1W0XFB0_HYPEX|nr:hypothetical protein BV898_00171 [Hypsibius exemplaris]